MPPGPLGLRFHSCRDQSFTHVIRDPPQAEVAARGFDHPLALSLG